MMLNQRIFKFILPTLILLINLNAFAQLEREWRYTYADFTTNEESNLYFRFEGHNFFKNNEYFGDLIEGYTLMGYSVQPSLQYYVSPKLRIKAGVHLLKYNGISDFTEVIPVYSAHLKLAKNFDMIMGSLKGDVQHKLIEPIFNPENQYTRPVESGLQFILENNRFYGDVWIDWDQFIFSGDTIPEQFTFGISSAYTLVKSKNGFKVDIPFQFVARHIGGQISNYSEELQTQVNIVSGLNVEKELGDGFIHKIALSAYCVLYKDLTESAGYDFTSGNAIYPVVNVDYKYGEFMLGYWSADNFMSPQGSSLFHSVSSRDEAYYIKDRQLLNAKISYVKNIAKQVKFSAMFESYYDIDAGAFEYSYGLNLVVTPNFFIKNIPFK